MKKFLIILFILILKELLFSQFDLSIWNNIRNSSYTIDNQMHVRCETIEFPELQTELYYLHEGDWNSTEMQLIEGFTYEGVIDINPEETQYCRFKTENDTLVAMMPAFIPEDVFPPSISDLSYISDDAVGDTLVAGYDLLDITGSYFGYSETRFYAAIKNNGEGFPLNSGGFIPEEFYTYIAGIINPENVLVDSTAYALIYVNYLFLTPGLYKIVGTDLSFESLQRIGDIETEIIDSVLVMACDINSLTLDEHFGEWPSISKSLGLDFFTIVFDFWLTYFNIVDFSIPSLQVIDQYVIEPFENQFPELTEIEYQIIGPMTNINLWYYDIDENFPIVAEVITNSGNIYQMFPLSFDYTEPVEFFTEIPENDWNEITISFSDNGFEFVEHVIQNTDAEDIIIQSGIGLSNYPNPFNPSTTISFNISRKDVGLRSTSPGQAKDVEIIIYNIKGEKVRELPIVTPSPSHTLSITWTGTDDSGKPVSSGVYLYQLKVGNKFSQTRKMLLLK